MERSLLPSLTVMAEYSGGPLWARPVGSGEPVDPSALGLPTALVTALHAWNAVCERLAITDLHGANLRLNRTGGDEGARLAVKLQQAIPGVAVCSWDDGSGTPMKRSPPVPSRERPAGRGPAT